MLSSKFLKAVISTGKIWRTKITLMQKPKLRTSSKSALNKWHALVEVNNAPKWDCGKSNLYDDFQIYISCNKCLSNELSFPYIWQMNLMILNDRSLMSWGYIMGI